MAAYLTCSFCGCASQGRYALIIFEGARVRGGKGGGGGHHVTHSSHNSIIFF